MRSQPALVEDTYRTLELSGWFDAEPSSAQTASAEIVPYTINTAASVNSLRITTTALVIDASLPGVDVGDLLRLTTFEAGHPDHFLIDLDLDFDASTGLDLQDYLYAAAGYGRRYNIRRAVADVSLGGGARSIARHEELNRAACVELIGQLSTAANTWGSLRERLMELLDASYDPLEGRAPMQPGSLATLAELVRRATDLPRPSITLTSRGLLWIEWKIGAHERVAAEVMSETRLHFAWVKPDKRRSGAFASRYATLSVDELLSEEFEHMSVWRRIRGHR